MIFYYIGRIWSDQSNWRSLICTLPLLYSITSMQHRSRSRSNSASSNRDTQGFIEPTKRLFVSGIPTDTDQNDIKAMFGDCGKVVDFYLKIREDGSVLCFVEMESLKEADNAIATLNGIKIGGKMIWVKYSKPKAQREDKGEGSRGGKPPFGRAQGGDGFRKDEGFKTHGNPNYHQGRPNSKSKGEFKGSYGNGSKQEGGFRDNRPNSGFQGTEKREYSKESSGLGREGRVEQSASRKGGEELDY